MSRVRHRQGNLSRDTLMIFQFVAHFENARLFLLRGDFGRRAKLNQSCSRRRDTSANLSNDDGRNWTRSRRQEAIYLLLNDVYKIM